MRLSHSLFLAATAAAIVASGSAAGAEPLRAGIIGCDTSHVIAFTRLINDPAATGALAQVEVVAAFPGGSPDLTASRDRLAGYVDELKAMNVAIVDSIPELVAQCDVLLLESVDGRVHLDQFRQAAVGKPVFIDKPAAASLVDLLKIFRIADETKTPCFTASALRFCSEVTELKGDKSLGDLLGCETTTPYSTDPTHPDFFWYAIHGVESLFAMMGAGCESVSCVESDSAAVATGRWSEGRLGVMRGIKQGQADYAVTAFGESGIGYRRGFSGYGPLVEEICAFFVTRKEPVDRQETIGIFAFMEAADKSKREQGREVAIADVLAKATELAKQE